jgi:hypothetical protein
MVKFIGLIFDMFLHQCMKISFKMKLITYTIIFSVILTGCGKENLVPNSTNKYSDNYTSNSEYWYNGTTGTALVRVMCKNCTAIASFGDNAIPFLFNEDGVGYLKFTQKVGLPVYIAVCPDGTKAIKVDILDSRNMALFSYSGNVTANWINTYVIK